MAAKVMVEINSRDHVRVMKRIAMLEGVSGIVAQEESVDIHECQCPNDWDLKIKCGIGARPCDIEELLLGVPNIKVTAR